MGRIANPRAPRPIRGAGLSFPTEERLLRISVSKVPFGLRFSLESSLAMSNATIRGIVHLIEDTKTFGQKGFRKRTVVLEQNQGRFTNYIPLDFIGDACDSADALSVGDDITVNYRLSGRKWQRDPQSEVKYFLSAEAMSYRRSAEGGGILAVQVGRLTMSFPKPLRMMLATHRSRRLVSFGYLHQKTRVGRFKPMFL